MNSTNRPRPYLALIPILVGIFIAADDQTVVATVLPIIMLDLRVEVAEFNRASWTITGYLLGYISVMPLIGKFSDTWGHRRLFLFSLLGFMAGSVAVALAPSLSYLIAARIFQAIGAGALIPISIALAGDLFPPGKRGIPLGLIGASAEAGAVVGPLWGGLLTHYLEWRWVFWINIPLSLVVIIFIFLLLEPSRRHPKKIDFLGAGFLAVSLITLTLGFSKVGSPNLLTFIYWGGATLSTALFLIRQRTVTDPLLPPSLFKTWGFNMANIAHIFVGAILIIIMVTIPLMANTSLQLSPLEGGLLLARLTVALSVGAVIGGLTCQRRDYRIPSLTGVCLAFFGLVLMSTWDINVSGTASTLALACTGFGFGLLITPILLAATESVAEQSRGTAAAVVTATRIIGMTLGLAALSSWGSSRFDHLVSDITLPFLLPRDTGAEALIHASVFEDNLLEASMTLFSEFFLVAMALSILAVIPISLMSYNGGKSVNLPIK